MVQGMKKSIGASMGAAGVPSVSEEVHTLPQLDALALCLHAGYKCPNNSVMLQHYWSMPSGAFPGLLRICLPQDARAVRVLTRE